MSKKLRLTAYVIVAGVSLLSVSAVVVLNRELARSQARIEAALSAALGRDVVIEGGVSVGLALSVEVVAQGIRIGNPDWASRNALAYADRAEVRFELMPLVRSGQLIVTSLELEDVDVRLEQTDDGSNNWSMPDRQDGGAPLPQIHELVVRNAALAFSSPDTPERQLRIDELEARRIDDLAVALDASGAIGDRDFEIVAATGQRERGSAGGTWPFELQLDTDGLQARLEGEFAEAFRIRGLAFEMQVVGGDTGWVQRLFDLGQTDVRYEFSSSVVFTGSGFRLSNARAHAEGLSSLERVVLTSGTLIAEDGAIDLTSTGTIDGMPFEVSMNAPEGAVLSGFTGIAVQGRLNNTELDASGNGTWADGSLALDIDLAVATPRIDDFSELLNVTLPAWGPFRAAARLGATGGRLDLSGLTAQLGESRIEGQLSFDRRPRRPLLTGRLRSNRIDLSDFGGSGESAQWSRAQLDRRLPTEWLAVMDARIEADIAALAGAQVPLTNISFQAAIENGRLSLEPLNVSLPGIELRGAARLSKGAIPSIELAFRTEELRPEDALSLFDLPALTRGVLRDLEIRLRASGQSIGAVLARAEFSLAAGAGDIDLMYDRERDSIGVHLDSARLEFGQGDPARLVLSGNAGSRPFELTLAGGEVSSLLREDGMWRALDFALDTTLAGEPVMLSGSVSPLTELLDRGDVSVNLIADWAGVHAESNLVPEDLRAGPVAVQVWSDDTSGLLRLLGLNAALATSGEGHGIVRFADGVIRVEDVSVKTPFREVTGGEFIVATGVPRRISAEFDLDTLDVDRLTIDIFGEPDGDDESQRRLLPARSLPLHLLRAANLDSTLRIKQLNAFGITASDVVVSSLIDEGVLQWRAATQDGSVAASIDIDSRPATPQAALDVRLRDYQPRRTRSQTLEPSTVPPLGLNLALTGSGDSIASFFGTASGEIRFWAGPGKLRAGEGFLGRNLLLQILDTLRPASREARQTELNCAAAYFDVADGIASSTRGLVAQTRDLNVVGGGAINFVTEEVSISLRFRPRRGLGLNIAGMTAPYVNVDGPVLNPKVRLNRRAAAATGGAAWASGGMSLLYTGVIQRIFSARRPCERVLPELAPG